MKAVRKLVMVLCATIGLHAGDPGPFSIDFYDAGVPPWLDRDKVLSGLKSKKAWLGITSRAEENGRRVMRVFNDSPAKKAGIEVGDIITNESWNSLLKDNQPNDVVDFIVLRGKKKMTKTVKLGARDPLVAMLITTLGDDNHMGKGHRQLHNLSMKNRQYIYKNMFIKNRAFDCENAHKKLFIKMLPNSKFTDEGAQVIVLRGSHRVMFINKGRYSKIGANTICVNSADYDGKNLTAKRVDALYWKLFGVQIDYWYENP